MNAPILTHSQIAVLNAARSVLADIASTNAYPTPTGQERTQEAATVAESSIFRVLNVAHNYGGVPMTAAQLHNERAPEPEPATPHVAAA